MSGEISNLEMSANCARMTFGTPSPLPSSSPASP